MALDTTVGGASANSYPSLAEADAYQETRLHNTNWSGATDATKEQALQWATQILDLENWKGYKATAEQALRWPRTSVVDRDGFTVSSTIIPQFLKNAVCELALVLIGEDTTAAPDTSGFNKIKVGPIELGINAIDRKDIIPDYIKRIIRPFLASGFGVPVVRI